jgi:phage terminase large subunit GpA-like protein
MNKKGKSWIFALQGDKGQEGAPVLNRGSINNKLRVKQFTVGTATAKSIIFARLSIDEYGPGYIHFPNNLDEEWYKQLTSEKRVPHYEKGVLVRHKWVKIRARNEVLDIMVYNLAALEFLNVNLTAVHRNFNAKLERLKEEKRETENDSPESKKLSEFQSSIKDQESSDQDLRKYRRPKKKFKITRQNNFATNY